MGHRYHRAPTKEGILYCAAVMDAYSRLMVGWSIAGRMRTELVTDALGMAIIRRQPHQQPDGERTVLRSGHGSQYTSWAFGQRLHAAGLFASMGTVGDCYDNCRGTHPGWQSRPDSPPQHRAVYPATA
jgi:putative transposase